MLNSSDSNGSTCLWTQWVYMSFSNYSCIHKSLYTSNEFSGASHKTTDQGQSTRAYERRKCRLVITITQSPVCSKLPWWRRGRRGPNQWPNQGQSISIKSQCCSNRQKLLGTPTSKRSNCISSWHHFVRFELALGNYIISSLKSIHWAIRMWPGVWWPASQLWRGGTLLQFLLQLCLGVPRASSPYLEVPILIETVSKTLSARIGYYWIYFFDFLLHLCVHLCPMLLRASWGTWQLCLVLLSYELP